MNLSQFLLKNLKKTKLLFVLFLSSFILGSTLNEVGLYLSTRLLSCFKIANKEDALHHAFFILSLFAGAGLLQAINRYFMLYLKESFVNFFQSYLLIDIFTSAHAQSTKYFDDKMSGVISSAVVGFAQNIINLSAHLLFHFLRPLISFIFSLTLIASFSKMLALSLFLLSTLMFLAFKNIHKETGKLSKTLSHLNNKINGVLVDSIANHRLVKYCGSFLNEKLYFYKHIKAWGKEYIKFTALKMRFRTYSNLYSSTLSFLGYLLILFFADKEKIAIENTVYAFANMGVLTNIFFQFNNLTQSFFENYGSLKANFETIFSPLENQDKEGALNLNVTDNSIEFKNVTFSYIENKTIFKDLNLKIKANERVGIVGPSGAGKSTLINLLLRSYQLNSGEILISGQNISEITETSLHKNIALVSQETALFNRSIYENIKIANTKASFEEVQKAAKSAQIHDTIMKMPNGYDSVIGERGLILSAGERQRLSIARAILQNAPILILDEATSALDTDSEAKIEQAIAELIKNKTILAIAHRLSTLKNMERILVLKEGEIIEDDTWETLLNKTNGAFSEFYHLQFDTNHTLKREA